MSGALCGNGLCEAGDGEHCLTCPADCAGKQTGAASKQFCCGAPGGTNSIACDTRCIDAGSSLFCRVAPYGAPDGQVNTTDLLVCLQRVLGLKETTDLQKAHADLYPIGAPDGIFTLSDLILLQKLVWPQASGRPRE